MRRPKVHLVASVLVLGHSRRLWEPGELHSQTIARPWGPSAPSSVGNAALEQHFDVSQAIPVYILVQSPHDLRTPQALADLEQMAQRISQLPNIALVSGITRPFGGGSARVQSDLSGGHRR